VFFALRGGSLACSAIDCLSLVGRQAVVELVVDDEAAVEQDMPGARQVAGDLMDLEGEADFRASFQSTPQLYRFAALPDHSKDRI
jgi:hypothetical protein